ncbi:hypothetical protein RHSIM_RhsimUnG0052900 [Rhododendron simsii]|uniref:RRM domain-containing protein n=1 Tax=Rhododendron simsii TaxID=118357 RepID=A0A834FX73_RHOSS|nr:hypothetical protein RHSIM_RhsimUnG0052900 [Rhododendron simsii]
MNRLEEIGRVGKGGDAFELRKSTIFVDNLPNGIRKGFVYNLFSRFGKIWDCYIPDKTSKRSGQNFGFIRFESIRCAIQAVESTNRAWIWGRELIVNVAKFAKKQGGIPTQIYDQHKQINLAAEDGSRYQRGYNNQHPKSNPQTNNGNAFGNGKEIVIYQQSDRTQRSNPNMKGFEKRGNESGRKYNVRVEEEDTFRTVSSTNLVPNFEVTFENKEEDDEVEKVDDELDANKNSVDDMETQGNEMLDDRAKTNEEEAEKVETNYNNGSHQAGLEKAPLHEESLAQRKSVKGKYTEKPDSCENNNKESINSDHGLESIVQDSQSPVIEECFESVLKNVPVQNAESNPGANYDQEKEVNEANNSGAYESNVSLRASQLPDINLHIELNPSAVRRNIRSQQFEASVSTEEDDIDGYIIGSQEQEQDAIEKELQHTILAGNTLGIKVRNSGILRMKKMIENEALALKASMKNNTYAPLMRD